MADNQTRVLEQRELHRYEATLEHNETTHHLHQIQPTMVGEPIRVVWLLFLDNSIPNEPRVEDTEYTNHLWINVTDSNS
ncbi:MAG: DUF1616 domain-containing protein [Natrialbaceae archaeon]|nr:DUF1616 domain-containing protein [Natrialbaceae archaeon]